ncbi:MAG: polysaccharide biosynthesis/export family protein [Alphaproteobacteria bacterium]
MFRTLLVITTLAATTAIAQDFSGGLTGMGHGGTSAPSDASRREWQQRNAAAAEAAAKGVASVPAASIPEASSAIVGSYTLGAGDKVRITVYGEEDLSGEFEVDGTGRLSFPLVGDIQAGSRTPREVEKAITDKLNTGYLVNPRVNVEVLNFRPFFILGEVNKPGSYPYVNDMSVISAVALAGGYTARAKTGNVYLKKAGTTDETSVTEDTKIQPGDVIRVDERFF